MQFTPVYLTPRAFLIDCLSNVFRHDCAFWFKENDTFCIDKNQTFISWYRSVLDGRRITNDRAGDFMMAYANEFLMTLRASTIFVHKIEKIEQNPYHEILECRLATKSTDVRGSVNDLKKADLYQWIIQLLCEHTRIDWIQYTNKNELEFEILDMKGMGDMYSKVNGIKTGNGVYNMKLLLSSYCMTGILKKIGKCQYKMNKSWYMQQLRRIEPQRSHEEAQAEYYESLIHFPTLTLENGNRDYPDMLCY